MTVQDVIEYFQKYVDGITLVDGSGYLFGMDDVAQGLILAINGLKAGDYAKAKELLDAQIQTFQRATRPGLEVKLAKAQEMRAALD